MNKEIEFSVILPVCHGGRFLERALKSLALLEFPREQFEVLLAGPGNDEELRRLFTVQAGDTEVDLKYISVARMNRSAQLNTAISQAKGNILVFTDDDCIFPTDWLDRIAQVFTRERYIGVMGGQDRTGENDAALSIALDHVLNSFLGTGGLRRKGSGVGKYYPKLWNMAIPREVALSFAVVHKDGSLQIFDESLEVHEDVELIHRIEGTGKRVIFAPDVRVFHSRDTTLRSFTKRSFNMARTSRSIGVHRLPHLFLLFFVLSIITLGLAAMINQLMVKVLAAVCAIYVAILLVSTLGGYIRTRRLSMFYYVPALILAQHFSRGLGYLFPWRKRH